jgi:hypothetical protein
VAAGQELAPLGQAGAVLSGLQGDASRGAADAIAAHADMLSGGRTLDALSRFDGSVDDVARIAGSPERARLEASALRHPGELGDVPGTFIPDAEVERTRRDLIGGPDFPPSDPSLYEERQDDRRDEDSKRPPPEPRDPRPPQPPSSPPPSGPPPPTTPPPPQGPAPLPREPRERKA